MALHFRRGARLADAWKDWSRRTESIRWRSALFSLLFSGLGQYAQGHRLRGFVWAASPAILLAAFLATHASGFLFASLFTGLFTGPFPWLLPLSLAGWIPSPWSPVFWFGALAKLACVADTWMVKTRPEAGPPSRLAMLLLALPQLAAPLLFCGSSFVITVSGVHSLDGLPGDILAGPRNTGNLQRLRGRTLAVRHGGIFLTMRLAALPGEEVELDVDAAGNVLYRVSGREAAVYRDSTEFCAWMRDDGEFLPCRIRVEVQDGIERHIAVSPDSRTFPALARHLNFQLAQDEVFLLSDFRNVVVEPAWLRVPVSALVGRPRWVLWSSSPSRGIHWHRIGRGGE